MRSSIVTLTTDFGTTDGYVGTMKGVVLDIAPDARLVDITHQIPPQDVRMTAYTLHKTYRFFSSQAIHLVVVDPGVGSARRPIAVQLSHGTFIGPDNGVFSYVMAEETVEAVVELANPQYHLTRVSETFHGRDIFAPAAAHLAAGVDIHAFGPDVPDPVTLPLPRLEMGPQGIRGEVLSTDHFGNVITSIGLLRRRQDHLVVEPAFRRPSEEEVGFQAGDVLVIVEEREIQGVERTYADVSPGQTLALVGSEGYLEIAVRQGNAAERLGLKPGDPVELRW